MAIRLRVLVLASCLALLTTACRSPKLPYSEPAMVAIRYVQEKFGRKNPEADTPSLRWILLCLGVDEPTATGRVRYHPCFKSKPGHRLGAGSMNHTSQGHFRCAPQAARDLSVNRYLRPLKPPPHTSKVLPACRRRYWLASVNPRSLPQLQDICEEAV
jgi:hypothetical protein